MNVQLLRRIQKRILKEPKQFCMGQWFNDDLGGIAIPNCGTAACIAGWAMTLHGGYKKPSLADNEYLRTGQVPGMYNLELNRKQSERLFYFDQWPVRFKQKKVEGTKAFAVQAVRRIDHFIKTKGAE